MKLKDYLISKGITMRSFAKLLDYTPSHMYKIVYGERLPSIRLAKMIVLLTRGDVKFSDLRPNETFEEYENNDDK